ncbi:Gfo/Idh/MocA family oxidoreductase [bacterium]|nr:Gfo/Idh/MocA family oxidoreductase [bacterium]
MLNIGIVGYGYWGPNLVRNFSQAAPTKVKYVCDLDSTRLKKVNNIYPDITTTTNVNDILNDKSIDAVSIATPVSTHFDLAMKALKAGKHVLMEKPLTDSSEKCQRLIEEADKQGLVLMVDHTFPYTAAVQKIKELVSNGDIGDLYYYDSARINLGLFQHDVSVIWDLAVHDLSILEFIHDEHPIAVSATGISHVEEQPENIAYLTIFYKSRMIAHIHVNWLAPVKLRQTLIGGSKKMILYDDMEPSEKIKIYDKGITLVDDDESITRMRIGYRSGDVLSPNLDRVEALSSLVNHFARCIETGEHPMTSAESGMRVVRIMEAASESMAKKGEMVSL